VFSVTGDTLQGLFDRLAAYRDRPAVGLRLDFGARWWSFAELQREACGFARLLKERQVPAGARMLLWAANSPEWVSAMFGAILRGIVVVPVDGGSSPAFVCRLAAEVQAALVVHGPEQDVSELDLPTLPIFSKPAAPPGDLEGLRVPVLAQDAAFILYTSGTTSQPKGWVLTHENLVSQVRLFAAWGRLTRFLWCRMLGLTPLSHVQGLVLGLCAPLSVGVSVLYTDSTDPIHVIRTIRDNRITLVLAVPRVLHLLAQTIQEAPYGAGPQTVAERLRPVRFFPLRRHLLFLAIHRVLGYSFWVLLVGGSSPSPGDERFWYESGIVLVQGYGLTETAGLVSLKINNPFGSRLGSIGQVLPNQSVRLAGDGELLVRGRNITPGSYGAPATSPAVGEDGYLRTGDLARRDARGQLYFVARKKDVIVTSEGFNVFPQDVEAALAQIAGVREAVVCEQQIEGGTCVHAALLLGQPASPAEIVLQANRRLEPHQRITSWSVWPGADFPRNSLSKVKRSEVQAAVSARLAERRSGSNGHLAVPSLDEALAAGDRTERLALLARHILEAPPELLAQEPVRLHELGLSSLDMVELITLLERRAAVPLDRAPVPANGSLLELRQLAARPVPLDHAHVAGALEPIAVDHWAAAAPRTVLMPVVLPVWFSLRAKLKVTGSERLGGLRPPVILAGSHHRHGMDSLGLYRALPRRLRWHLFLVTSQWVFREYLNPDEPAGIAWKAVVAVSFHVGMPLLFPFCLWPKTGASRHGFFETCRLIDRGYSPIVFPENAFQDGGRAIQPGIAVLARQTQAPVVPFRLSGNEGLSFRPRRARDRVTIRFGQPLRWAPDAPVEQISQELRAAFQALETEQVIEAA
jgi:long-chain acyl-CoA synthetase